MLPNAAKCLRPAACLACSRQGRVVGVRPGDWCVDGRGFITPRHDAAQLVRFDLALIQQSCISSRQGSRRGGRLFYVEGLLLRAEETRNPDPSSSSCSARPQPPRPKHHPPNFFSESAIGLFPAISRCYLSLPSRPVQPERCRLRFTPSPSTPAVAFCKPAFTCRFAFVGLLQIALEAPCSSLHPLIHALLAGSPTHLAEYRLAFLDLLFTGSTASSTSAPFLHIISASP